MKKFVVFSFILFLLLAFTGLSAAAPVGKVTLSEGRVDVLKVGRNMATPVSTGDPVDVGDIYRAKSRSRVEITFLNKNMIRIAPGSRVEIKEYMVKGENTTGSVRLHRGKVQALSSSDFVKRVAAFAEGNRFEVHTLNAVAGIRGSDMIVSVDRGATMVIFVSGKGYLYNPARPDVVVPIVGGQDRWEHLSSSLPRLRLVPREVPCRPLLLILVHQG
jgi:hypothetical protein